MSNQSAWEQFDAYIDGELSIEDAGALEAEVGQSETLNSAFESYLSVVRQVQELPSESPPADFYDMVRRRIRRRARSRQTLETPQYSWSLEAAICVVLLGLMSALYMFAEVHPPLVSSEASVQNVARVHLEASDRKVLAELGLVTVIGTSVAGNELEVEIAASADKESLIRETITANPRLHLIETSVFRHGKRLRARVRAPAGPFALK